MIFMFFTYWLSNREFYKNLLYHPSVFPGGAVVKNLPANSGYARDLVSMPGLGRPSGIGNGNTLQYSCLEISMDRGAWWATIHGVAKSQTKLSNDVCMHVCTHMCARTPTHTHTHTHNHYSNFSGNQRNA